MRSLRVVIATPSFDHDLGLPQGIEKLTIQKLISEFSVERLDISVLPRRARGDEQGLDLQLLKPRSHGTCDKLRSVVRSHMLRNSALHKELSQGVDHIFGTKLPSDPYRKAFSRELVNDIEHPKGPSVAGSIHHEVVGPYMVFPLRPKADTGMFLIP